MLTFLFPSRSSLSHILHSSNVLLASFTTPTRSYNHLISSYLDLSYLYCLFPCVRTQGSYLGRLFSKGFDMNPHHALPSANVIENPFPEFSNMPTPTAPPSFHANADAPADGHAPALAPAPTEASVMAATSTATSSSTSTSSLPLIPPFRIPWKVRLCRLSVCLCVCLYVCLCVCLFVFLSVCLSVCRLFVCLLVTDCY